MERLVFTILALGLLCAAACRADQNTGTGGAAPSPPSAPPSASEPLIEPPPADAGTGSTALSWATPAGWVAETPSSRMRKAQYRISGEAGDAECVVFYFGPGEGGDAMENAQRWAAQFTLADGRPGSEGVKIDNRKVGDIDVLTVEVAGTYQGGFRMQKLPPKPNQLLLGAIAKGPDANWFFKLTGPAATVEGQRAAFESLVASFKQGG
jgi:hypothetical protein